MTGGRRTSETNLGGFEDEQIGLVVSPEEF